MPSYGGNFIVKMALRLAYLSCNILVFTHLCVLRHGARKTLATSVETRQSSSTTKIFVALLARQK
jgi:hypothetical protein